MVYSTRQKFVDHENSVTSKVTSAERTKRYRERLRDNQKKKDELKERDRLRHKEARERERQKARADKRALMEIREKKRNEMRKYRAKKKAQKENDCEQTLAGKKKAKKQMKKKQNAALYLKRKQEKMSKKQACVRTTMWRMRIKLDAVTEKPSTESHNESQSKDVDMDSSFNSRSTEFRATQKVKSILPSTPRRKARVIEKVLTPQTSSVLKKKGLLRSQTEEAEIAIGKNVVRSLKNEMKTIKVKGTSTKEKARAQKMLKSLVFLSAPISAKSKLRGTLRKYFGFTKGIPHSKIQMNPWWRETIRKKRKDSIPDDTKNIVRDFFLSNEISRETPLKKEVIKCKDVDGIAYTHKHEMVLSIPEAHTSFKAKFPNIKIGLTSFRKLKPANVKKVSETNRKTCLCTQCSNVSLKLEAIKKFATAKDQLKQLGSVTKQQLSMASLCEFESKFPMLDCMERNCDQCKEVKFGTLLDTLIPYQNESIKWCHWEYIQVTKKDKVKRIMSCVEKETSIADFQKALSEDMKLYPIHHFRANWQQQQLALNQQNLKEGEVLLTMDFSENYRCVFKDEVQCGFFEPIQVTVHPAMAYYLKGEIMVKHAIIGISSDLTHDAHFVKEFEERALNLVTEQSTAAIKTIFEWTDGCAAQYKGKTGFADISLSKVRKHRNFFETSHGKGVCDGLGAVVKNTCLRGVVSGKAILSDADEVFKFCKIKLAHGPREKLQKVRNSTPGKSETSIWDIIKVPEVAHQRPEVNVCVLKGTRLLHSMRNGREPYALATRAISCYCKGCGQNDELNCENTEWVKQWTDRKLILVPSEKDKSEIVVDAEAESNQDGPRKAILEEAKTQGSKSAKRKMKSAVNAATLESLEKQAVLDLSHSNQWSTGDFVAVRLGGKKSSSIYMAVVVEQEPDTVHVKYMKKCGENLYVWPQKEDDSWEPVQSILCRMEIPLLANEREQFQFKDKDIDRIKAMASEKLK